MKNKLTAFLILALAFTSFGALHYNGTPKNTPQNDLEFEVSMVRPPLSISEETLSKATTLNEINKHYPASWVKEYLSVEVTAIHKGTTKTATNKSETLSDEQKQLMKKADIATEIAIKVRYIPDNNLKTNEPKVFEFAFLVNPEQEAHFPKGEAALKAYLQEKVINHIADDVFEGYDLAAVKFTIDEKGKVANAQILWSSEDETTDKLLLEAIQKMPKWQPAEYSNGKKIAQDFAFMVGNMENCMVHTLNI